MKNYKFFPQQENMCLASCIQSILDARGFPVSSQKEIASHFKKLGNGIDLDETSLNNFLLNYRLKAEHYHPQKTLIEPDFIIKDALERNLDNLVAYSQHVSLVRDFDNINVFLLDPEKGFAEMEYQHLIMAMLKDIRCGFYLIGEKQELENII